MTKTKLHKNFKIVRKKNLRFGAELWLARDLTRFVNIPAKRMEIHGPFVIDLIINLEDPSEKIHFIRKTRFTTERFKVKLTDMLNGIHNGTITYHVSRN